MRLCDQSGAHGGCDTDLRLAPAFCSGECGVVFAEIAYRRRREQSVANFFLRQLPATLTKNENQRRYDASGSTGRCCDHQMATSIFLGACQGIGRDDSESSLLLILVIHSPLVDLAGFRLEHDGTGQSSPAPL